jgi:hypothetical protein
LHDTNRRLRILEETRLEADDDDLHSWSRVLAGVVCNLGHIGIVEGGVDFVKDEEGQALIKMLSKKIQGRPLSSCRRRERYSMSLKRFRGGMAVGFETTEVEFVAVLAVKVGIATRGERGAC